MPEDNMELLLEAERRGLLNEDEIELLNEARTRGLIPGAEGEPVKEKKGGWKSAIPEFLLSMAGSLKRKTLPGMALSGVGAAAGESARQMMGEQPEERSIVPDSEAAGHPNKFPGRQAL